MNHILLAFLLCPRLLVEGSLTVQQGEIDVRSSSNVTIGGNLTIVEGRISISSQSDPIVVQSCFNLDNSSVNINFTAADVARIENSNLEFIVYMHLIYSFP